MRLFPGESGLLLFGLFAARLSHQIKMIFVGLRIGLKHAPDFLTLRQALSHLCCGCSSSEKINSRVHAGNRTNGRTIGPDCAPGSNRAARASRFSFGLEDVGIDAISLRTLRADHDLPAVDRCLRALPKSTSR